MVRLNRQPTVVLCSCIDLDMRPCRVSGRRWKALDRSCHLPHYALRRSERRPARVECKRITHRPPVHCLVIRPPGVLCRTLICLKEAPQPASPLLAHCLAILPTPLPLSPLTTSITTLPTHGAFTPTAHSTTFHRDPRLLYISHRCAFSPASVFT